MTTLYQYQKEGVKRIQKWGGRVLLSDEMGLGKTIQTLSWISQYLEKGPYVCVCPASLKWNWKREARVHTGLKSIILEGKKPNEVIKRKDRLYIINYDILGSWLEFLKSLQAQVLVIDEGHYCKSRTAKRTKNVVELSRGIPHLIAITGTPLTNRPAELWPLLNLVRPDLYPSFWSYATRYCQPEKTPWGWQYKGATHLDELHSNLSNNLMIRRRKKDVLGQLPSKARSVITLPLSDIREYERAKRDFFNWLRRTSGSKYDKARKAKLLTKMGYLKRLCGKLKLPSVVEWVEDFLESEEGKLILFGVHKAVLKPLHERFKSVCTLVDGSVTGRDRQRCFDTFTQHPKCRLFLGNIQAAGVGWNGTVASTVAFAELAWTPGEHSQAEDRIHRIGQKETSFIYYLIAQGTIEDDLCKILQRKQKVLDETLDGKLTKEGLDIWDLLERELLK